MRTAHRQRTSQTGVLKKSDIPSGEELERRQRLAEKISAVRLLEMEIEVRESNIGDPKSGLKGVQKVND